MKYIFIVFAVIISLWFSQGTFAASYKSNITLTDSPTTANSDSNINRAALLSTHINNFQRNINTIAKKYWLQDDETIISTLKLVEKMSIACNKIQTNDIEKQDADEIMRSIVTDLSKLNTWIKKHLKAQIDEIDVYHDKYANAALKIATHLDILNTAIEKNIDKKETRSDRDRKILKHVRKLKKISRKLKVFWDLEISKKSEIRSALIRFIRDIRKEVQNIKNL